jgi:hypothetical protein
MAFTLRTIFLAVAVILFVIAVFVDDPLDWWSWGLAAFAASFLVAEMGWDRSFGAATTRDRDTT